MLLHMDDVLVLFICPVNGKIGIDSLYCNVFFVKTSPKDQIEYQERPYFPKAAAVQRRFPCMRSTGCLAQNRLKR